MNIINKIKEARKNYKDEIALNKYEDKMFAIDKILNDMTDRDIENYRIMIGGPRNIDERYIKLYILDQYLWCFTKREIIWLKRIINQQAEAEMSRGVLLDNLNHEFTSEELETELISLLAAGEYQLENVENEWKKYLFNKNSGRLFDFEIEEWQEKLGIESKQK